MVFVSPAFFPSSSPTMFTGMRSNGGSPFSFLSSLKTAVGRSLLSGSSFSTFATKMY